jgi:glycerol-3-phosphate acyltransferase PlsY
MEFVMSWSIFALAVVLAYLLGSVPFGYLMARWRGVDILKHGSGNIGATNVGRVLGRRFGILVFLLDFAKGALPTLLARWWTMSHGWDLPPESLPVAAAIAAFLGHIYPVYLHFRGGKGVATAAGAVMVLLPEPALAALFAWFVVVAASRYVSLASLAAAAVLCLVRLIWTPQPWSEKDRLLTLFCLLAAGLIALRHRANIGRLLRGNENRMKDTPAMLHLSKMIHVLALGLWFGTAIFFSFVVGLNLFGTFEEVAAKAPAERPIWFPMWKGYDGPTASPELPNPLRKEQGSRAGGVIIAPMFRWYFGIQGGCALLAAATAWSWRRLHPSRVHTLRALVLLAALVTVALGAWLEHEVHALRQPRNESFDAMISRDPPRGEEVAAALAARQTFARWHLYSLGINMLTVLLVAVAMAQAAFLPSPVEDKKLV